MVTDCDFKGWEGVQTGNMDVSVDVQVDSSKLPLTTNGEGEQVSLRNFCSSPYMSSNTTPWLQGLLCH